VTVETISTAFIATKLPADSISTQQLHSQPDVFHPNNIKKISTQASYYLKHTHTKKHKQVVKMRMIINLILLSFGFASLGQPQDGRCVRDTPKKLKPAQEI
jgi:hypothetical protein